MKFFRKKNPILIFLAIFILLIIFYSLGFLRPGENFAVKASKPIAEKLYRWGKVFNHSSSDQNSPEQLAARIDELTKEVAVLTVISANQKELVEENKKLRSQLDFLETNNYRAVAAEVTARESLLEGIEEGQDLIINKGSRDGVMVGQGVVSEEGLIIGKIIEVKDVSAKACLTTSSGCRLAATIQNESRTQGLTDGDLGLTIRMDYIPQLEKLTLGDTVITSGLGDKIPRGLVIGKISEIRNESNEVWQNATIEPLINLNNILVVSVIIL